MAIDFQTDEAPAPSSSTIDFQPETKPTKIDFQPEATGDLTKKQVGQKIAWESLSPEEQEKRLKVLRGSESEPGEDILNLPEHEAEIFPLHGYKEAAKSGYESGQDLLGKNAAGKTLGAGLATVGTVGTIFNPIMYGGRKLAQGARIAGDIAGGDTSHVEDVLTGKEEVMPWLTPEGTLSMQASQKIASAFGADASESSVAQTMADLEKQLRDDPANAVMILDGVGKLGVKGYALREGRLGRPLNPTVARLFPEVVEDHAKADTERINRILRERGEAKPPVEEAKTKPSPEPEKPPIEEEIVPPIPKQGEFDFTKEEIEKPVAEPALVGDIIPADEVQPTEPVEPGATGRISDIIPTEERGAPIDVADGTATTSRLRSSTDQLGVEVSDQHGKPGSLARIRPDGSVVIEIGSDASEAALKPNASAADRAYYAAVADEELIHSAFLRVISDKWKALPEADRAGVDAHKYAKQYVADIFTDMRSSIKDWESLGREDIGDRLKQTFYDSWSAYNSKLKRKMASNAERSVKGPDLSKIKNADDLMTHLENNPSQAAGSMMEFMRQLQQMKEKGTISEFEYHRYLKTPFAQKIIDWIRQVVDRIKAAIPDVEKGNYGERLRESMKETEEMLKKVEEDSEKLPSRISEEELARADMEAAGATEEGVEFQAKPKPGSNEDIFGWEEPLPEHSEKKPTPWKPSNFNALERFKPGSDESVERVVRGVERHIDQTPAISPTIYRWVKGLPIVREAAVETLRKAGGYLTNLGSRISEFYDGRDSLLGKMGGYIQDVLDAIPKKDIKQAMAEFEEYMTQREGARLNLEDPTLVGPKRRAALAALRSTNSAKAAEYYSTMTPHAKKIVDMVKHLFKRTGQYNDMVGIMNKDPETGLWRKIGDYGENYWPKILKDSVRQVLENPKKNPVEYRKLIKDIMKRNGLISPEQAIEFLRKTGALETQNANIMGNLKFARTHFLPESFYEYDFNKVIPTFIARWADDVSKVKYFGQELSGEAFKDAFNDAISRTSDEATKMFLKSIQGSIYGHERTSLRKLATAARAYSTMTKLTAGTNAFKNLGTIFTNTYSEFGAVNAFKAQVGLLFKYAKQVRDAQKAGVLKHDMVTADAEIWDMTAAQRKLTQAGLKYSGFTPSEIYTRVHAAATGLQWARWALRVIEKNPNSRAAAIEMARFKKLGINPQMLAAEGFEGEMAQKLMRASARNTQFTYDLRQVPAWMDTPEGKLLFQYGKFGAQMMNRMENDVIKPALVGREQVMPDGTTKRFREYGPLIRTVAAVVGAGELMTAITNLALGKTRKDPSFSEITGAAEDGRIDRAIMYLGDRLLHDIFFLGVWGTLGDKARDLEDYVQAGRTKPIIDPPALAPLHNFYDNIISSLMDQGKLTGRDISAWVQQELPAAKNITSLWKMSTGDELSKATDRLARIRALGYRFQSEEGLKAKARQPIFGKTPNTADYRDMQEALMTGDLDEARRIKDRILNAHTEGRSRTEARKGLISSITARDPFKVGNIDSLAEKQAFKAWMLRRIGETEFAELLALDKTYQSTAYQLGLLKETHVGSVQGSKNFNRNRKAKADNNVGGSDVNSAITGE